MACYFGRIREICDRYGVLLILDEVMCGMCRTDTLFVCEQEGVRPDMLTIAKGAGGGVSADRGDAVLGRDLSNHYRGQRAFSAWAHLYGPFGGGGLRAGGARADCG